ncbi:MAG: GDYXXLXY domain-containing protein [Opitutus sp.]|nr:GDYXXLXY domain-containing protein [Opitutus sp.]MCS6248421.1 GDYXXLXY domain-containing protein [Opitutus sp.]MCS6275228.1 GDYXXLXY domain-containing protein [Opitutus sp.]MCS6276856.1 GDYXXLXY domain-containing protein [Opitutus sp.]MCS6301495.1 GDYXXLXY domain-containing protein [Opitutus sp.]
MKTLSIIIFGLAALAQWLVPLTGIMQHEQTLAEGTLVKLKCSAPDPYDPLRGRYLAVRPEQREVSVPAGAKLKRGMQVYASLSIGTDGLASVSHLSLEPPKSGDFIRLKSGYVHNEKTQLEWPFSRFYLNEKLAPEADRWFAENLRSSKGIIAEVRVLNGRAVLADLSFDGKSFREILKERESKPRGVVR